MIFEKENFQSRSEIVTWIVKVIVITVFMLFTVTMVNAQTVSGGWDAGAVTSSTANTGYSNHGNGVIQLLDVVSTNGCQAAAVHETSSLYDPTIGNFSKCYQVFFGCPGNDNIGSDTKGDGMAFSFSKGGYNISNGLACGGGLGYMGANAKMFTIEFDTYSSQGNVGFDANYGGGLTGNHDEIALQRDGIANDGGRITSSDAGNLEDGLEHAVCISYNRTTHHLVVTIDGATKMDYDLTGSPYELSTYFGAGGLTQTWSSGKAGATNPSTVSDGASIVANLGGVPLCPANVVITSPSSGDVVGTCDGPLTIAASTTPPANNTVSFVEFFVEGISIGTDNTASYATTWSAATDGTYALTAVAHFIPSNTTSVSPAANITVSSGLQKTATAPFIDGTVDPIWGNYASSPMTKLPVGTITGPADLSATYKMMRDANRLYLLVDVTDDVLINDGTQPWEDDGIELFIDMGNSKATVYGANDFQYAFVYGAVSATASEYKNSPASMVGVTVSKGTKVGGYFMEISIPWTTLGGAPADGDLIGFDIGVNDDDDGGTRDSKIHWYDATDNAFHDPSYFGTVKAAVCDPCPTGILTGNNRVCDALTTSPLTVNFTGAGPWSFTYSIDGVTQAPVSGISTNPYVFQSATGAHNYALVSVSNTFTTGCTGNATGTASIIVNNVPVGHDATFIVPGTATLSVDDNGGTYQWFDAAIGGNLVFTGTTFTTPVLTDTTVYYVQELSGAPCRIEVTAFPLTPVVSVAFFIPNLITPNNDGKNDEFEIAGLPNGSTVKLYNRWGDLLYQSKDYDNLWSGNNASDGVYYYELILPEGKQYKGWLQIVR